MKKSIRSSKKDFENKRKAYASDKQALNEPTTNQFFAPNVENIKCCVDTTGDYHYFYLINDGKPMSQQEIEGVLSEYGCSSLNTAGNENGMGLKSSASYCVQYCDTAMMVLASKTNGKICGIGWINHDGEYCDKAEFNVDQKNYVNKVLSEFDNGTATIWYNTKLSESELDKYEVGISKMFTWGLKHVNFTFNRNGREFEITPFDRHYRHLDYVVNDTNNFRNKEVVFEYRLKNDRVKLFKATLLAVNTNIIHKEDFEGPDCGCLDDDWDYGIHIGYDNGYMPLHESQVEVIGYKGQPRYYNMRGTLIAHPIENDEEYANVEDWKVFISGICKMSQQKVPQLKEPVNYYHKDHTLKDVTKSFYESVVDFFRQCASDWCTQKHNVEDKYTQDNLDDLNAYLKKHCDCTFCDSEWHFRFSYNGFDDSAIAKYDKKTQTVIFKFDKESPLLKRILKGGRNGRNGENDICEAITNVIDYLFRIHMSKLRTTNDLAKLMRNHVKNLNDWFYNEV